MVVSKHVNAAFGRGWSSQKLYPPLKIQKLWEVHESITINEKIIKCFDFCFTQVFLWQRVKFMRDKKHRATVAVKYGEDGKAKPAVQVRWKL